MCVFVTQSCPILCDTVDCSPPGTSVHGILKARILTGVECLPFSKGSSRPRNRTRVSCTVSGFFTTWATREALLYSDLCGIGGGECVGDSLFSLVYGLLVNKDYLQTPWSLDSWSKLSTREATSSSGKGGRVKSFVALIKISLSALQHLKNQVSPLGKTFHYGDKDFTLNMGWDYTSSQQAISLLQ